MGNSNLLISVVAAWCVFTASVHSGDLDEERMEVASFFESHQNVLCAIGSLDLLMEHSAMVMIGGIPSHELITRTRWIRITPGDQQLITFAEVRPLTTPEEASPEVLDAQQNVIPDVVPKGFASRMAHSGFSLSVYILRDGICTQRAFPAPIATFPLNPDFAAEQAVGAPELKLIGLSLFPGCTARLRSGLESRLGIARQPQDGYALVGSNDGRIKAKYDLDKLDIGGGKFIRRWEYDPEKLVFVSFRHDRWNFIRKKFEPSFLERFEWGSVGDATVPLTISGERLSVRPSTDDPDDLEKMLTVNNLYDYSFRWNAVNTEIDASLISKAILRDMNAAKAMTDPKTFVDNSKRLE